MEFKGWNTDILNNTWFDAYNVRLDSSNQRLILETEDASVRSYINQRDLCGYIAMPDRAIFFVKDYDYDKIIQFDGKDLNHSISGNITKSTEFNFSPDRWIKGTYTTNKKGENIILFWEGLKEKANEPKVLNIDDCPDRFNEITIRSILFSPQLKPTNIDDIDLISGSLPIGKYTFGISYDLKVAISNIIHWSRDIMLYNYKDIENIDNVYCDKSGRNSTRGFKLKIKDIDSVFKDAYINIAIYQNSDLVIYRSKNPIDLNQTSSIIISNLSNYEKVDNSIFIDNVQFDNFNDATINKDRLLIAGYSIKGKIYPGGTTDEDLQNVANKLKIIFKREYSDIKNGANPLHENKGLMPGEVYDIKIRFWYGSLKTKTYHIPGPKVDSFGIFDSLVQIGDKSYPYYTLKDTTTASSSVGERYSGYYPNKSIIYPEGFVEETGNIVRFHKTPPINDAYPLLLNDKILRIGAKIDGNIPLMGGITHYELLYSKRNIQNSNVPLIDFLNLETNTINGNRLLSSSHLDLLKNDEFVNIKPKVINLHKKWTLSKIKDGRIEYINLDIAGDNMVADGYKVIHDTEYELLNHQPSNKLFNISEARYVIKGGSYDEFKFTLGGYTVYYPNLINPYLHSQTRYIISSDDDEFESLMTIDPDYTTILIEDVTPNRWEIFRIGGVSTGSVYESSILTCNDIPYSDYLDSNMISTGVLNNISSRDILFNFDIVGNMTGIRATKAHSAFTIPDLEGDKRINVYSVVGLSRYFKLPYIGISNPSYRTIGSEIKQEIFYPYSKVSLDGIDGSPLNDHKTISNWNGYNIDANLLYPKQYIINNPTEIYTYLNNNGIYFSNIQNIESKSIGLINFKPINYINSKKNVGEIIGIVGLSNEILLLHKYSIVRAKTQVTLNSQEDSIQIQPIDFSDLVLEEIVESNSGAVGTELNTDYILTDVGLFIYSSIEKSIYLYNGSNLINISKVGLEHYFNYLNYKIINSSKNIRRFSYDRKHRRIIFMIKLDSETIVLSFDLDNKVWISKHEYPNIVFPFAIGSDNYYLAKNDNYGLDYIKVEAGDKTKDAYVIFNFSYSSTVTLSSIIGRIISTKINDNEAPIPTSIQIFTHQGISNEIELVNKTFYNKTYSIHNGEFRVNKFINILKTGSPNIIGLNGEIAEIIDSQIEKAWHKLRPFKAKQFLIKLNFKSGEFLAIQDVKTLT